jgi:hypothetical protein
MIIEPVTPQELNESIGESFPKAVINAFNNLLKEKYRGNNSITIKVDEVVKRILSLDDSLTRNILFEKNYLDVESLYRKFGWSVTFNSPDRDENFDSYYVFSVKK